MIQKTEKKGHMTSVLFTMLLFLVFVLSALFTVLIGSRVYENITVRSDASYTAIRPSAILPTRCARETGQVLWTWWT